MKHCYELFKSFFLNFVIAPIIERERKPWTPDQVRGDDRESVVLNLIQDPGSQWKAKPWIPDQVRTDAYSCHSELHFGFIGGVARKNISFESLG